MRLISFSASSFSIDAFKNVFPSEFRGKLDSSKNRFKTLIEISHFPGDWRMHTFISFYFELPDDAIEILTNSNLFTIHHERGEGVLSGSVLNFENFVTTKSDTLQGRTMSNIFYNILRTHFDMFKEYTVKKLGDGTFTMVK